MKISIQILVLWLLGFNTLLAQSGDSRISGKIKDTEGMPAESATILLLNIADSSYITGTITEPDGVFQFTGVKPNRYLMEVSMLGYKKQCFPVHIKDRTHQLNEIVLEEDYHQLAGVVVIADQKPVQLEAGKTIINLSSSILGSQGNALDALKTLPGVLVRDDGTIYLNGQAGVNVLMDDKLTYLSGENLINYLQSLPSTSINKIELITHPSSKYDAAGNSGFINIQTKKVRIQGFNLSVNSNYQQGKYARGNEGLNLTFRRNKFNVYADYSYNWGKDLLDLVSSRDYQDPVEMQPTGLVLDMLANRRFKFHSHYVRGGVDYDMSDKMTIGIYATGNWHDHLKTEQMSSEFSMNGAPTDSILATHNVYKTFNTNITGGINWTYAFKENGKWDASFDFQRFNRTYDQAQENEFSAYTQVLSRDTLRGDTEGDIDIYTGQTGATFPLSERTTMQVGAKTAFVSIDYNALYQDRSDNTWVDNTQLSNGFFYDENINAAFVQLNTKFNPALSIEAGLRLENTNIKGRQTDMLTDKDSVFTDHYTNLFPTLLTQFHLSENHSFSFMYGRRIIRPNYRDLNPFIEVNDRYLNEQGNTELKAEISDNIELSYYMKQQYGVSLFYSYRNKPITKSYLMREDNSILVMPMNLSSNHIVGLRLGLNNLKPFHWWTVHINSTFMYRQFHWTLLDHQDKNELFTPMVHVNNQYSLPWGLSAELTGFYNGKIAEGQATLHPMWMVSAGVRKNVLKNKGTIKLFVNDIFQSYKVHIDLFNIFQKGWYKEVTDRREIGISFTYRFNSGSGTKDSRRDNRIDESKRINL